MPRILSIGLLLPLLPLLPACTLLFSSSDETSGVTGDDAAPIDDDGGISCQASEECRPILSECDIAEFCEDTGCPEDIHLADGELCSMGECTAGRCLPAGVLLGYWPFDESAGEKAEDLTGQTGDATLNGAVLAAGKLGGGVEFDGLDDYATIPSIAYPDQFTMSFWFQIDSTNEIRSILSHGESGDSRITLTYSGGRGRLIIADIAGTEKKLNIGAEVADGQWHHLVLNRSTDGATEVFLDGGFRGRENMMPIRPAGPVYLGRDIEGNTFTKMSLDDLRVYSSPFTVEDARNLVQEAGDTNSIVTFAIADTFIESHTPNTSQGNADILTIKSTSNLGDTIGKMARYREAFIRFDVGTVPRTTSTLLRLYVDNRGSKDKLEVRVSALVDDTWLESEVTYNQQPELTANGQTTFFVSGTHTYTELDISEFIANAGSDGWLSLRLESRTYNDANSFVGFSSREGHYPPQLSTPN